MKKLIPIASALLALVFPAGAGAANSLSITYGRDAEHFRVDRNEEAGQEQHFRVFVRPYGVACSAPLPSEAASGAPEWAYEPSGSNEYQFPSPSSYTACATLSWAEIRPRNEEGPIESQSERTSYHVLRAEATSVELIQRQALVEAENAAFNPGAVSASLRALVFADYPGAVFPGREGLLCPEIYPNETTGRKYSICFAEFKTGNLWNLVGTAADQGEHGIAVFGKLHDSRWHRRWTRCSLRGWQTNQKVHGTLVANNGCTKGPQSDAYFVSIEGYYAARFRPGRALGWQFTQSAGFTSLGTFRRQGHSYTFTNAVGDSFRYTPSYR